MPWQDGDVRAYEHHRGLGMIDTKVQEKFPVRWVRANARAREAGAEWKNKARPCE